jgi:hypothetical protein
MIRLTILLLCSLIFQIEGVLGQSKQFQSELKMLNQSLLKQNVSMQIFFTVSDDKGTPLEHTNMTYKVLGSNRYVSYDNTESFENDEYILTLYHEDKQAVLNKRGENQEKINSKQRQMLWDIIVDTFTRQYERVDLLSITGTKKKYKVKLDNDVDMYASYEIVIDTALYLPVSIKLYYKETYGKLSQVNKSDRYYNVKPTFTIEYRNIVRLQPDQISQFYCKELVEEKTNSYTLKRGKYSSYTLYNYY